MDTGLLFGALALDRNAQDRATEAMWQNRVNAYLSQGYAFPEAQALARLSIQHEATNQPPPKGSIILSMLCMLWILFYTLTVPSLFLVVPAAIVLSIQVALRIWYLTWKSRRA